MAERKIDNYELFINGKPFVKFAAYRLGVEIHEREVIIRGVCESTQGAPVGLDFDTLESLGLPTTSEGIPKSPWWRCVASWLRTARHA